MTALPVRGGADHGEWSGGGPLCLWGVPTTISKQVPQPLLSGGYVYDWELSGPGDMTATGQPVGWYWLSVRHHYDPSLKCFLQPDPSGIEGAELRVCGRRSGGWY
jgi:hypothetical protein